MIENQNAKMVRKTVDYETITTLVKDMIQDSKLLKDGFKIFSNYEKDHHFYSNLLKLIFNPQEADDRVRKLACSTLHTFLRRNWSDDLYLTNEERMGIVSMLLDNITCDNYFMKNYIAKLLGLIAAREFPQCYEGFIKVILENLQKTEDPIMIDMLLRIITCVLKECDDRSAIITGEMLPVILNVFKLSKHNQKNREKCLRIVAVLLNKLSFADGTDPDLITKNLDTNEVMENCISLCTTILISNPKLLFDIKKQTITILDILVRDMPIYSSKFFAQLIEPSWRLIVLELSLYTETIVFNKPIEYTEMEEILMEDENHVYTRGYESDDEDEIYGMEGLIIELIDFAIDLLKRKNVMEALQNVLLTFLLCVKGYLLMPHNSLILWKDDPNLYITEEYDEENINTVRNKTINLMKEIAKEIDNDQLLLFLKIVISEFKEGVNIENYREVLKLDDYNVLTPYFENMNNQPEYIFRRHEANLLIIGTLADDILMLQERNKISKEEIQELLKFLFSIISEPKKESLILVGRALWCIQCLLLLVRNDYDMLSQIFEGVSVALCHPLSDTSVRLIASQCITNICARLKTSDRNFDSEFVLKNFDRLIVLLDEVNEETLIIPIDCILEISKLNKEKALYIPLNAIHPIVKIYSKFYNEPTVGVKVLELIKLWCDNIRSAKILMNMFVPFAIFVFDEFFKSLGKVDQQFEVIKKTVMTEHGGGDMGIKTSLDMLPNLIDIIAMLTKHAIESQDQSNVMWIPMIVNVVCDILMITNDIQIIQHGTSFMRFYIPLCKEMIIKQKQQHIILKSLMRIFDPNLLESCLLYVGNAIAQFFFHVETQIIPEVLEAIVRRTYRAKMPSVVQSLVLVFARFINKFPIDTITFLMGIQVENRVGLKVLIDKWLLHQPLFRGNYFRNVSFKALTILFEMKSNMIESLMVIGYNPSHSNASIEVNAPLKILSVLIRALHKELRQEEVKKEMTNYENLAYEDNYQYEEDEELEGQGMIRDEEEEDDNKRLNINEDEFKDLEDEPKELNSKLNFLNLQGKSGGLGNIEAGSEIYLSEMLGFDYNDADGEEEDNTEDDLIYLNDIDVNFVLKDFLLNWFKSFKEKDSEYLSECLKVLPRDDQNLFDKFNI